MKKVYLISAMISALVTTVTAGERSAGSSTNSLSSWTSWSPRDEIAPKFYINSHGGRHSQPALIIETHATSEFGAWNRRMMVLIYKG